RVDPRTIAPMYRRRGSNTRGETSREIVTPPSVWTCAHLYERLRSWAVSTAGSTVFTSPPSTCSSSAVPTKSTIHGKKSGLGGGGTRTGRGEYRHGRSTSLKSTCTSFVVSASGAAVLGARWASATVVTP